MRKLLTNDQGEVRELEGEDFKQMRSMGEILPADLQRVIRQRGRGVIGALQML